MIDFKTYDEQIEILQERGLIIDDKEYAKFILKVSNYYNVVNAYKDIFIQKGVTPETYISGARFSELKALHTFDKKLRITLSNYLIIIERKIKSIIAYEFSKSCPNHNIDYLNIYKYNATLAIQDAENQPVLKAAKLIEKLENEYTLAIDHNDEMICHYNNKYGRVPLWVFINKLTFGTISKMYEVLKAPDQTNIAKSLKEILHRNISPKEINNALKILVILRNKTAHDQRIYDFSSSPINVSANNQFLREYSIRNSSSLFGAIACMSNFLDEEKFQSLLSEVRSLLEDLFKSLHCITQADILEKMGIPIQFITET